jgi:hypothetical protein
MYNPLKSFEELISSDKSVNKDFRKPFKPAKNGKQQPGKSDKRRL